MVNNNFKGFLKQMKEDGKLIIYCKGMKQVVKLLETLNIKYSKVTISYNKIIVEKSDIK